MVHPCFKVDEILRILADEIVESGARTTAAALARCCKIFEDPVLDALWETQDRLFPLLKTFPGDVWRVNQASKFVSPPTALTLFSPPDRSVGQVLQQDPNESRMESFQQICWKDAKARRGPV